LFWATMSRSKLIARGSSRSRTVRSSPLCITVSALRKKTTKSSANPSLSLPGTPLTSSLWSRTQQSTPRPADGGSATSTRTAQLAGTRCSKPALLVMRRLLAILSSLVTRPDAEREQTEKQRRHYCNHQSCSSTNESSADSNLWHDLYV